MALKPTRGLSVFDNEDYLPLDKLQVALTRDVTNEDGTYTLCFWMYLLKGNKHGVLIRQSNARIQTQLPFLSVDADFRLVLHPLTDTSVVADQPIPAEKWVHIGCEVGHSIARLHMDGVVTGEKTINFPLRKDEDSSDPMMLSGSDGFGRGNAMQAYAHHVCALPQPSVTNHYVKNPPLELSLDGSTGGSEDHEVEEGGDGVWSVVGGKASCRRNFALDVVLMDALGRAIHKDIELVASLVYADSGYLVEKPKDDAEAPLLTTFDGVEFPSTERPIKLVHGRASFKLKISQLSSKCDNRLFRVCFESPSTPKYPFLRVFSRPIRCVSRNRNSRTPSAPWKRTLTSMQQHSAADIPNVQVTDDTARSNIEAQRPSDCNGTKFASPTKYQRVGSEEKFPTRFESSTVEKSLDVLPPALAPPVLAPGPWPPPPPPVYDAFKAVEDAELRYSDKRNGLPVISCNGADRTFPHLTVFKYCLETVHSRGTFLKALVLNKNDEEIRDFAHRVSQYTGCHHNGFQVLIAKRLLQEGDDLWKHVSKDGQSATWATFMMKLEESFYKVIGQSNRRFTAKDCEFLQQLSGSVGEIILREQFEKLWHWIFPVAIAVSNPQIRKTWESNTPKWIQGMISRVESEQLLLTTVLDALGRPKPGSFILRFASSRSWPHPDAGALVVSYVSEDMRINHRLLNVDTKPRNSDTEKTQPSLSELLLGRPELVTPVSVQQ